MPGEKEGCCSMRSRKVPIPFFVFGILLLSTLFTMQSPHFPLSRKLDIVDSAIYQYIGYLVTIGKVPYVDAFDHKGLLLYFINAIGYLINPKIGIWIVDFVFMALLCVLVYQLSSKFCSVPNSILVTIATIAGLGKHIFLVNTPDFYAVVLTYLILLALSGHYQGRDLRAGGILTAGLAAGAIFWLKYTMLLPVVCYCACIFLNELRRKNFKCCGRCVCFFSAGFLAVSSAVLLWLGAHRALRAMMRDYFGFNLQYRSYHESGFLQQEAFLKQITAPAIAVSICCVLIYLVSLLRRGDVKTNQDNHMFFSGLVALAVSLAYCAMLGNAYIYYGLILFPGITMILICVLRRFAVPPKRFVSVLSVLVTCGILGYGCFSVYASCKDYWYGMDGFLEVESELVDYIENNTAPDESIAIVSTGLVGYYIETQRIAASRNNYIQWEHFKFEDDTAFDKPFWDEYISEIEKTKPALIIFERASLNSKILAAFSGILSQYSRAGISAVFSVYSREDEPALYGDGNVGEDLIDQGTFTITEEMREAYQRGELTLEEIMEMVDKQIFGK